MNNENPLLYYVVLVLVCIILLLCVAFRWRRNKYTRKLSEANPKKITISDIDHMIDGSEFEQYLCHLLTALEYEEVYKTTASRDFGADIVFQDSRGLRCIVQAKRYAASNPVGLSAVQEIYTAMRYYRAQRAVVLTSGRYTEAARILAGVNHVLLLDRDELIDVMNCFKSGQWDEAKEILEQPPETRETQWQPPVQQQAKRLSRHRPK